MGKRWGYICRGRGMPLKPDVAARATRSSSNVTVAQNEKFTRSILPKHFKHSNMASFVRQLNKYDFHKVRQTNDTGNPQNGANVSKIRSAGVVPKLIRVADLGVQAPQFQGWEQGRPG